MKKAMYLVTIFVLSTIFLIGCSSGISQDEYDKVKSSLSKTKKKYETLTTDYEDLKKKCDEYESIIRPYKDLSEAEIAKKTNAAKLKAKKDKEELEAIKKKEKAEKKAKEKAAKEAKDKEEKMGYETGITFSQLARNPDKYEDKKVKFNGKVVQLIEGDGYNQIRLAVNNDYDSIILIEYDPTILDSRILEDDTITIYGVSAGVTSYQSTLGGTISVPSVYVDKIDL